jgi:hypothetical protein
MRAMETIPPEAFLAGFPDEMRAIGETLRTVVRQSVPNAVERVREGWRLIGYDVPVGRRKAYFAFIAPETEHVHLGFEYGTLMDDPERVLLGAHLGLRKVRFLTFRTIDDVDPDVCGRLIDKAARLAMLSQAERRLLASE